MRGYTDPSHADRREIRSDLLDELDGDERAPLEEGDPSPSDFQSITDGERAIERALEEWRLNIVEPKGQVSQGPILEKYIRQGIEWDWVDSYQNRKFAWCGAFAAWAWWESVSAPIRQKCFPSTYRLREWAKGSGRVIDNLEDARAGDIVIVGHKKAWGDHITLLERHDEGGYWSVEGNAWGETPSAGARREGVIRRFRSEDEISAIYRPLESDR